MSAQQCVCSVVDHEIVYCPLHAVAGEMRETLQETRQFLITYIKAVQRYGKGLTTDFPPPYVLDTKIQTTIAHAV